jgi:hypothetical protein
MRHELLEKLKVSNFFNTVLLDNASHLLVEFGSFETNAFVTNLVFLDDVTVNGDSLGSHDVSSGNHTDSDTSLGDGVNGAGNLGTENNHNTENANKSKTAGLNVLDLTVNGLFVAFTVLSGHNVLVSEGNGTKSLLGVSFNDIVKASLHFVSHETNVAREVNVVVARVLNDFRGNLNVETFLVAMICSFNVLENSGHPLAFGG